MKILLVLCYDTYSRPSRSVTRCFLSFLLNTQWDNLPTVVRYGHMTRFYPIRVPSVSSSLVCVTDQWMHWKMRRLQEEAESLNDCMEQTPRRATRLRSKNIGGQQEWEINLWIKPLQCWLFIIAVGLPWLIQYCLRKTTTILCVSCWLSAHPESISLLLTTFLFSSSLISESYCQSRCSTLHKSGGGHQIQTKPISLCPGTLDPEQSKWRRQMVTADSSLPGSQVIKSIPVPVFPRTWLLNFSSVYPSYSSK